MADATLDKLVIIIPYLASIDLLRPGTLSWLHFPVEITFSKMRFKLLSPYFRNQALDDKISSLSGRLIVDGGEFLGDCLGKRTIPEKN